MAINSTGCGDYGQHFMRYLLNEGEELKMVQAKSIEPFYDEKSDQFLFAISETIIDFNGTVPTVKAKSDALSQDSPTSKMVLDEKYDSPPWIILNEKGDDFVLGKKIDYKDDWYEASKKAIKERLSEMTTFTVTITIKINGQIGMGTRSEFRSMCGEAITETVSLKEYEMRQRVDHFKRMKKPFAVVFLPKEEGPLACWNKRYHEFL